MSKTINHAPKHRAASARSHRDLSRRVARTTLMLSSAAAVTALAVAAGVAAAPPTTLASASAHAAPKPTPLTAPPVTMASLTPAPARFVVDAREDTDDLSDLDQVRTTRISDRAAAVSRSARRDAASERRQAGRTGPRQNAGARQGAVSTAESLADDNPRDIAQALLPSYGFSADQFGCLDSLWARESGWDVYADNPTSSAYGIPQALPGSKMASAGADWADNPATQIGWGLGYIRDAYGTPCSAWDHSQTMNWY